MLKALLAIMGMAAVGWLTWTLLKRQEPDDPRDPESGGNAA